MTARLDIAEELAVSLKDRYARITSEHEYEKVSLMEALDKRDKLLAIWQYGISSMSLEEILVNHVEMQSDIAFLKEINGRMRSEASQAPLGFRFSTNPFSRTSQRKIIFCISAISD